MAESESMARSSPATTFGTLPSIVKTEDPDLVSGLRGIPRRKADAWLQYTAGIVGYADGDACSKVE